MLKTCCFAMLCMALAGCSFTMRSPPTNYRGNYEPNCDTGTGRPVADGVGLAIFSLAGAGNLGAGLSRDPSLKNDSERSAAIAFGTVSLGIAAIEAWALGSGISTINSCKKANAMWAAGAPEREEKELDRQLAQCTSREKSIEALARTKASGLTGCAASDAKVSCSECNRAMGVYYHDPECTVALCMRELTCTGSTCEETPRSKELQVALDRLVLETTCERGTIALVSQAEWRVGTETAFRLRACNSVDYVCTVAAGRAACSTALAGSSPR